MAASDLTGVALRSGHQRSSACEQTRALSKEGSCTPGAVRTDRLTTASGLCGSTDGALTHRNARTHRNPSSRGIGYFSRHRFTLKPMCRYAPTPKAFLLFTAITKRCQHTCYRIQGGPSVVPRERLGPAYRYACCGRRRATESGSTLPRRTPQGWLRTRPAVTDECAPTGRGINTLRRRTGRVAPTTPRPRA